MSTVDPDAARREREQQTPTARDIALPAVVSFVQPALAAVTLMRMIANASVNNTFDGASILALVLTFPGTGATIFGIVHWATRSARNPRLPDISAALGLVALGVAAGLSVASPPPAWVQPPSLKPEVIVLGILGIAILGYSVWARRARLRKIDLEDDIMRSSPPVTGVVTNQGYDVPDGEASALLTTVTYSFVDAAGTRRFVQKWERMPMSDLSVNGEKVDLWYDRQDPSDVNRIVVRRRARESGER